MGMKATALLGLQAVRLLRIEKRLNAGGASMAELLAMLDVAPATVKRDLVLLREELGAPVQWDNRDHRYHFCAPWPGVMAHLCEQAKLAIVADLFEERA